MRAAQVLLAAFLQLLSMNFVLFRMGFLLVSSLVG